MATPLSADKMLAALKKEGLKPVEYGSWRTHNRDAATGKTFGPVNGIVIHHTAGRDSLNLVYKGRSDLPGPLAHAHLSKTGTLTLTGNGRVNHAGSFPHSVRDRLIAEAKPLARPVGAEDTDANDYTYGLEIENLGNGKDPYPDVQYKAAVKWAAAICRAHGWSSNSVIGHKEGTTRKVDPSFDMNKFRSDVAAQLNGPATPVTTQPTTTQETTSLTAPSFTHVRSTNDTSLAAGAWYPVSFETEYADEPVEHAANAQTVIQGPAYYSGTLSLKGLTLGVGFEVQVQVLEDDLSGNTVASHPIGEMAGTAGSTFYAFPFTGKIAANRRLKFQIQHWDDSPVSFEYIDVKLLSWDA